MSGKYLGEVARCVMEGLVKEGYLLGGGRSGVILLPWSFSTACVSEVEL